MLNICNLGEVMAVQFRLLVRVMLLVMLFAVNITAKVDAAPPVSGIAIDETLDFFAEHVGGLLVSCNFSFQIIALDYVNKSGAPVVLTGSFGILTKPSSNTRSGVALAFKLVPADASLMKNGQYNFTIFTPNLVYLVFGKTSTVGQELITFKCDSGGLCVLYRLDNLAKVYSESTSVGGTVSVAYQRAAGQLDVAGTLKMPSSPSEKGWTAFIDYQSCLSQLLKQTFGK